MPSQDNASSNAQVPGNRFAVAGHYTWRRLHSHRQNGFTRQGTDSSMSLIQRIDALLPQTQCGKCGHPGCKPYAVGLANGEAINKCPPGGDETIAQLAQLLNLPVIPLDHERGVAPAQVAYIREAECIGCTKCIQACPVDAILGAAKMMHTVIVDECTGCDLCVAPCPVDCIELRPLPITVSTPIVGGYARDESQRLAREAKRNRARYRFEARSSRLKSEDDRRQAERLARSQRQASAMEARPVTGTSSSEPSAHNPAAGNDAALKQARIAVAMSRAQLNKSLKAFGHPPIEQQAARLAQLQQEFESAEHALDVLMQAQKDAPDIVLAKPDAASVNRAKIQLAMRRAALKKAVAAQATPEMIATLSADADTAERALRECEASAAAGAIKA